MIIHVSCLFKRIESLINPELTNLHPVQVPHHKGRKRMHLGKFSLK